MADISLRGCTPLLMGALKSESAKRGKSVNKTIFSKRETGRRYGDLDHLAGIWSAQEAAEFDKAVEGFETIDRELWQ
ncbi:MAG: hypothetical protein FD137_430 [Spirochaetes bacterium]|nr:MAG: hypothetical protein FD137_430 [Spirochaetota bacterium]